MKLYKWYISNFEKNAEINGWPEEHWVTIIQPNLNHKAQTASAASPRDCARNFQKLTRAIFQKFELSPEHFRPKFKNETKRNPETRKEFKYRLRDLQRKRLELDEYTIIKDTE